MNTNNAFASLIALTNLGVIDAIRVDDTHVEVLEQSYDDMDCTHRIPFDALDSDEMSAKLTELAAEYVANDAQLEELAGDHSIVRAWDNCNHALGRARADLSVKVAEMARLNDSINVRLTNRTPESLGIAAREQAMAHNIARKLPELEGYVGMAAERLAAAPNLDDESRQRVTDAYRDLHDAQNAIRKTARALIDEFADRG